MKSYNKPIRKLVHDKFGPFDASYYWYLLTGNSKPNNVEYFNIDDFQKQFGNQKLIQLIKSLGYSMVYELNESRDDEKINVDELEITNSEVYYCNDNVDWLIYGSHEQTVTFGGEAILQKLKQQWLNWHQFKDPWQQYL